MKCNGDCFNCKFDDCIGSPPESKREKINSYQREYRAKNPEKFKEYEHRRWMKIKAKREAEKADAKCKERLAAALAFSKNNAIM